MPLTVAQPARYGYHAVVAGAVIPVRDLQEAAARLVAARAADDRIEVTARVSLTRERPLTAGEQNLLITHATNLIRSQS
jgi:hypothetical protein